MCETAVTKTRGRARERAVCACDVVWVLKGSDARRHPRPPPRRRRHSGWWRLNCRRLHATGIASEWEEGRQRGKRRLRHRRLEYRRPIPAARRRRLRLARPRRLPRRPRRPRPHRCHWRLAADAMRACVCMPRTCAPVAVGVRARAHAASLLQAISWPTAPLARALAPARAPCMRDMRVHACTAGSKQPGRWSRARARASCRRAACPASTRARRRRRRRRCCRRRRRGGQRGRPGCRTVQGVAAGAPSAARPRQDRGGEG